MAKLLLHEAIEIILLSKEDRTATIEDMALEINKRGLYHRKDGNEVPPYQIMQRAKLSNGQYHHLFEWIGPDKVRLKNTPRIC